MRRDEIYFYVKVGKYRTFVIKTLVVSSRRKKNNYNVEITNLQFIIQRIVVQSEIM